MAELVTTDVRIETMDREFLDHLEKRLKEEFENSGIEVEEIRVEQPAGILPIAAALIIAFGTAAVTAAGTEVGKKVGEIVAQELDEWYKERKAEKEGVQITTRSAFVE